MYEVHSVTIHIFRCEGCDGHYKRGFAQLVSEQRLCVVNAASCEIMHVMEITSDYRTGFTDKMRIRYRMRDIVQP